MLAVAGMCLATSETVAGENSSLSDLNIEFSEAKMTLQSVTEENSAMRAKLRLAQEQVKSLTDSLAIANSEAEVFKRESRELKLRMEALGIESAGTDKAKLEQRLLKAVSDLKIVQDEKDKVADQLVRMSEAVLRFLKSAVSTDAEARLALETEMRGASEALGLPGQATAETQAMPATLTDAMVISVKEEFALVVANLGTRHGVKIGMPFQVWRGENLVGHVRVVDVREKIAGAVIQDLNSNKDIVKVGDRLRVDARP